jgi:hypothetical protein
MQAEIAIRRAMLVFIIGVAGTLALGLVMLTGVAFGQVMEAEGFKLPEFYDPPHETQMKWLLEGAKARPLAEGQILIDSAKYQTFSTNGDLEMTAEAPQCVLRPLNSGQKTVSSAGPLQVRTADGKLYLEGKGFLLQTNSVLIISNNSRTVIRGAMTNLFIP